MLNFHLTLELNAISERSKKKTTKQTIVGRGKVDDTIKN
jgi:hypothetical protein